VVSWRGQLERKEKSVNLSIQDGKSNQLIRFRRQGRIFIFGSLGYFQLGALLEGSRRSMSYKLALEVLATFTEQVVPIHKHIILFWIPSISGTKTVIMKLTKKPAVKLSDNTPITYLLSSLCNCTVCKCHELAMNKAPALFTTPNSLLLYIVGDWRDFCLKNRWKFCDTLSF